MATVRNQNNNIRLTFIILNIVILIELCRTAPTLTPINLTNTSNILFRKNITPSVIDKFKTNFVTTDFPNSIRNSTKSIKKLKNITKNVDMRKLKEKTFNYLINNPRKLANNFLKNTSEIEAFTVLTPVLTVQEEFMRAEPKPTMITEINPRYPETLKSIVDTSSTAMPSMSTEINRTVLLSDEIESLITSTRNIKGLQAYNKTDKVILINNSIIRAEISKNKSIATPVENVTPENIASLQTETTFQNSLVSTSDLIETSSQISLSQEPMLKLTTESHKHNAKYSTVAPVLEKTLEMNNNIMIADNLKLSNTEQIIDVDSLTNKKLKIINEPSTFPTIFKDKLQNKIQNTIVGNYNKNRLNNSSEITLVGHDGVKITKKKQLVENNFEDDKSIEEIHANSTSFDRGINDKKIEEHYMLAVKEKPLSTLIMTKNIITDTKHINIDIKSKKIATSTATNAEIINTSPKIIEKFATKVEDESIILPDVDLLSKNLQVDSITEIPILTSTENDFIKHKNFEKSLITKMDWIPIQNVDHTETKLKNFKETPNKLNTIEKTTIFPIEIISEINDYQTTSEILSNTDFSPTTKQSIEYDEKSLDIELIDPPKVTEKNSKIVPEFFEIITPQQHQNNNEKESDSLPIEIQINVSEGFGNETENLEFSFRQQPQNTKEKHTGNHPLHGFEAIEKITVQRTPDTIQSVPLVDHLNKNSKSNENDEILQVEITAIDNTTKADEKQSDTFNDTPKFTVHNEQNSEIRENDDFFVPDLTIDRVQDTAVNKNFETSERDTVDQDADTIFYISNTEVKVAESLPTSNLSNYELNRSRKNISQDSNRSKLESQFFPTIYEEDVVIETQVEQQMQLKKKSTNKNKENVILSSRQKKLKLQQRNKDPNHGETILNSAEKSYKSPAAVAAAAAPDVSYVGETFIEIEESTSIPTDNRKFTESHIKTTTKKDTNFPVIIMDADMNSSGALLSDVIIQPAIVSEISIGVPVIGELPPQIELKEIDFLPVNNGKENYEKLIDAGSIQYGGDLIADEAEINDNPNRYIFESGYPFTDEKINRVRNNDRSDILENDDVEANSQQIIMHAVNNLQNDQLFAEVPSDQWEGYKETPIKRNNEKSKYIINESDSNYINNSTNFLNSTGLNITELLGNTTAFLEDNEGIDFNLADIQTLIIACFATLIPLILSLLTAFGVRYLWIKYRHDHDEGSGLVGDSSSDPLAAKSVAISRDELQTTESGYTLNRSNNTLNSNINITSRNSGTIIDGFVNCVGGNDGISHCTDGLGNIITDQLKGNKSTNIMSNHIEANGSITTMTLKNNHLIVETEERNDISRDARETKMHYTSSEKDGVFVVEVARGADSTGAPGSPNSNLISHQKSYNIDMEVVEETKTKKPIPDDCNHEEVQIHQPPVDSDNLLIDVGDLGKPRNYKKGNNLGNSNTGLSQSDLSSSSDDSNKAYSYGKQELYTVPKNGYSPLLSKPKIASPESIKCFDTELSRNKIESKENNVSNRENSESKPIITAALLKQDTINELNSAVITKEYLNISEFSYNGDNKTIESKQEEIDLNGTDNPVSKMSLDLDDKIRNNKIEEQSSKNYKNGIHSSEERISGLNQENIQKKTLDIYENGNRNGTKENCAKETEHQISTDNCINGENGFDSIISLPEPPSTEEIKQMNDIILMYNTQLDSLPPPPPPLTDCQISTNENTTFNNISPIPEYLIEEDKLLQTEDCTDKTSTPLTVIGSS